jgi:hypothetical protein
MMLSADSRSSLRDKEAAAFGRELVERATDQWV